MKNIEFTILAFYITFSNLISQEKSEEDKGPVLKPSGKFDFMTIGEDNRLGISDAGSRLGLRVTQKLNEDIMVFGGIELAANLSQGGGFAVSPNNSTTSGFVKLTTTTGNVFTLRKGFVGADFKKYGVVSVGKQYGAYYDVAGITDISENNSGYASFAFSPQGTDGGSSGTGRASNSFVYRNTINAFNIAVSGQAQLGATSANNLLNSLSTSVIYKTPFNINIGAGYNQYFFKPDIGVKVKGLNSDPKYAVIGINYNTNKWFAGLTYAYEKSGDLVNIGDTSVVFDGYGIELSAKWNATEKWGFLCGVNYKQPQTGDPLINGNYRILIFFYGVQFMPRKNILLFFEGAFNNSINETGNAQPSNIGTGMKFEF